MVNPLNQCLRRLDHLKAGRVIAAARKIVKLTTPPSTHRAEQCFEKLQSRYQSRPEYGYDDLSLYQRAAERSLEIIKLPGLDKSGMRGLEVGSGDGMLSMLLNVYGHQMTLTDLKDWRTNAAKNANFVPADCCNKLPMSDGSFDFVISYNTFEHFPRPEHAFAEIFRVLRPGGLMHFQFNPLFCSPWGLHAYRTLRMPYPQFLFSDRFIQSKLDELGIWDLGKKRAELQNLNQWKPEQYNQIWMSENVEVVFCALHVDDSYLGLIIEFPDSFSGRGLKIEDLTTAGVTITLRKK